MSLTPPPPHLTGKPYAVSVIDFEKSGIIRNILQ